jgi:predicted Fe-Mo cluster-binding NifX family protein
VFVETDDMQVESVENANVSASGGAGVQAAQRVADHKAKVLLTGNCGPNAFRALEAAGVEVITGVKGTVRTAASQYVNGAFKAAARANVDTHFGTGAAFDM